MFGHHTAPWTTALGGIGSLLRGECSLESMTPLSGQTANNWISPASTLKHWNNAAAERDDDEHCNTGSKGN